MGRHTPRIEPVPGNHEYRPTGAAGDSAYFGEAAGDPTKDNSYDWRSVSIDSEIFDSGSDTCIG